MESSYHLQVSMAVIIVMIAATAISIQPGGKCEAVDVDVNTFLEKHNEARADVGVAPVKWSATVAAYAEAFAAKRAADCAMEHSYGPYGENLAGYEKAADAVKAWTDEKPFYDYDSNSCVGGECGHYTNVVYHGTTVIGCATVKCSTPDGWFTTCNYSPPMGEGERPFIKRI